MNPIPNRTASARFVLAVLIGLAPLASARQAEVAWETYTGRAHDGSALEGMLGRIEVPEDRAREDGPAIELAFVVYASDAPEPGPPIVFLAGGPGASGVELAGAAATDPRLRLLDHGDVIGIDQRGTGLSRPNLADAPRFGVELPLDRAVGRDEVLVAYTAAVERCWDHWLERGVELAAWDTDASANDVDAVRDALGIERIVPFGTSYGSHLGLAYLRRHPEHAARAVLMKVEGPDHTHKLPSAVQRRLERASELVAADPVVGERVPDLAGLVGELLARLEEEPVTVSVDRDGEPSSVTLGAFDLRVLVATALGHTTNLATLPMALDLMRQGEWRHALGVVVRTRRGEVGSAMGLAMDCASGGSAERLARIERERRDPANLLADAMDAPWFPATCAPCDGADLGDAFRAPLDCDVPTLFVSGELDARTPPENVDELLPGFPNGAHLVVTNTGHDARELESERYRALVHAFLSGDEVESATIELPPIAFAPPRDL